MLHVCVAAIGLDKVIMHASTEVASQIGRLCYQEESNPVSMWERFLSSRTNDTPGDPLRSASDTSLLTLEAACRDQDEVEVVFCTSCDQKDLGQVVEKLSGQRDIGRVVEKLSEQKDLGRGVERLSGQNDLGRVVEKSSGQKDIRRVVKGISDEKDLGRVVEKMLGQKDLGRELSKLSAQKHHERMVGKFSIKKDIEREQVDKSFCQKNFERVVEMLSGQKDLGLELENLSSQSKSRRVEERLSGRKDLGQDLYKLSGKRQFSEIVSHVPVHPRILFMKNDRRGKGIPEEVLGFTERDTAASETEDVSLSMDGNVEKTNDQKTLYFGNSHSKPDEVSNPDTLARMCKQISESSKKIEVKGRRFGDSESVHFRNGRASQASDVACYIGSDFPHERSSEDDPATMTPFDIVDESRDLIKFGITTSKAELFVCDGQTEQYDRIGIFDLRRTLRANADAVYDDQGLEVFPSDSDEEWLVSEHAIDSSVAEIVKENEFPSKVRGLPAELNPHPSIQTDLLASTSCSDEPDQCCYLNDTKQLECYAQGDIGKDGHARKFAVCEDADERLLIKNALASEICVESIPPEISGRSGIGLIMDWERKAGDVPSPIYDGEEEQFERGSDFEMDVFSVFPPADFSDELPGPDHATKKDDDDASSPIDSIDVVDLLLNFPDEDVRTVAKISKQFSCADNVCNQESNWLKREESGIDAVGIMAEYSGDGEACLISWDTTRNLIDHPLIDTKLSAAFGSSVADSTNDAMDAFRNSFNDTSPVTRQVTDHLVNETSLMPTKDDWSSYALPDTQSTITSKEINGRNPNASSTDIGCPIGQDSMYDLFDHPVNDANSITGGHWSSYTSPNNQNLLISTEAEGRNLFTKLVDETTQEHPSGHSFNDTSLITLDECTSYPSADIHNIANLAETKGKWPTTPSSLTIDSELGAADNSIDKVGETSRVDYSSCMVADTQNFITSDELKGRNCMAHSIDDGANENRYDLSGIDENLISLDHCSSYAASDTMNIVTSSELKAMKLITYSVADGGLITKGATDNIINHSVNERCQVERDGCSQNVVLDFQSTLTSAEITKASGVSVMELFPCDERNFKTYQYFVRENNRTRDDSSCNPINRNSLNDIIPYVEADKSSASPLPELPDLNLNTNNETPDFAYLPDMRGVTESYLEQYLQSKALGVERGRDGLGVPYDEVYSQELPVIPEEDLSTDDWEQCGGTAEIEYRADYSGCGESDDGVETRSENSEADLPSTIMIPFQFEDGHDSYQRENDKILTELAKEKEDIYKILTEAADIPEQGGGIREGNGSYENARDNDTTIPINEQKFEENLKMFRPFLSNSPDFKTTTYATLRDSPPLPKTFFTDSEEFGLLDDSESNSNDPDARSPCDLAIPRKEDVGDGSAVVHSLRCSCEKLVDIYPVSENKETASDPAVGMLLADAEVDYQIQQSRDWTASYQHAKNFEDEPTIYGSGKSQSKPPADSKSFSEERFPGDQGVWLSSIEEESGESDDRNFIRYLRDYTWTTEDSQESVEADESCPVFRPHLNSHSTPKLEWDQARKAIVLADTESEYFQEYFQSGRSRSILCLLESAQGIGGTENQESAEISDEYSFPGEKVFRVPKCVLKGIVNYEDDYDDVKTPDETIERKAGDNSEQNLSGATLHKSSHFELSANDQDLLNDQLCFARNTCERPAFDRIRCLSVVPFAEMRDRGAPNISCPYRWCDFKGAEQSDKVSGRHPPCSTSDRVLTTNYSLPSDAGSGLTCESPNLVGVSCSKEAESLQLPGPESILHPCLEAWFCSQTSRNGKPNSFMIESEAQTEEESTGLLAHLSENTRPKIAEGNTNELAEQVTRYGTAGFTIHSVDRCKSPIKSSGSYSGPEAEASELSINDGSGNYSLIDSDSGEKCIPQGTIFVPSGYSAFSCNAETESCSANSGQLIDLEDGDLKTGLTSVAKAIDSCQSSSSCEKSKAETTAPDRAKHGTVDSEGKSKPGFTRLGGDFEDGWFLAYEENEQRLKEIIARDPEFEAILQRGSSAFCYGESMDYVLEDNAFEEDAKGNEEDIGKEKSKEQDSTSAFCYGESMDYVLEDDAFEEDAKGNEEEDNGKEKSKEEESKEEEIEKERKNTEEPWKEKGIEKERNDKVKSSKEETGKAKSNEEELNEAEIEKEIKIEELIEAEGLEKETKGTGVSIEEKTGQEKSNEEESKDIEEAVKGGNCWQDNELFKDQLLFMDRPPSPFADDWFTDSGPERFTDQLARGSKEYESFIRQTTTVLEKYYEQALAGTCTLARKVKEGPAFPRDPAESEKDLNGFLPRDLLPAEFEPPQLRTDDSSVESVYLTPASNPFSDDTPLEPGLNDIPDFLDSEELGSSNVATCGSPSKADTFCAPGTPVLDSSSVDPIRRCSNEAEAESQAISVADVPDNDDCPADCGGPGFQTLSTHDIPDIPDVSFHSNPEESWASCPDQEQNSETDSGGSSFQSGPEYQPAADDTMDVVAGCLVKKAIDYAQSKILETTNSLPFNIRINERHDEAGG